MKSLFKKIIISGFILSLFATILCFGIFLQPKTQVFADTYATIKSWNYGELSDEAYNSMGIRDTINNCYYIETWAGDFLHNNSLDYNRTPLAERLTKPIQNLTITNDSSKVPNGNYAQTPFDVSQEGDGRLMAYVFANNNSGYDCVIYGNVQKIYAPADSSFLFAGYFCLSGSDWVSNLSTLLTINIDPCFDTLNVTSMAGMFFNTDWKTGERALNIYGLQYFDTSNVTRMDYMFCFWGIDTDSLDLSAFDTSDVTNMISMFEGMEIETLDLSSFDTSSVTNLTNMFYDCGSLTSLDISSWDLSGLDDSNSAYSDVFYGCDSLTTIYLPQNLGDNGGNIELPSNDTWDYEGVDNKEKTTLGAFSDYLSDGGNKNAIYASSVEEEDRIYSTPRTAETGVFVDVILPVVFVLIVGTLAVMYIKEGKKKKFIIR